MRSCIAALVLFCAAYASAQSLADAARQERIRQLSAPTQHIITNEDLPGGGMHHPQVPAPPLALQPSDHLPSADQVRQKIAAQKQRVASLQARLQVLQQKLAQYAPVKNPPGGPNAITPQVDLESCASASPQGYGPYVRACRQAGSFARQIDDLKSQLSSAQQRLEQMQEEARSQGFGNAVYDPD
jgi:uncharacterized coiled-coil protein SlyX